MCMCILSYPACKARDPFCLSSVVCPALQYFSILSHKRYDFQKQVVGYKMYFLIFLQLLCEIFIIIRRFQRDIIRYIAFHIKV